MSEKDLIRQYQDRRNAEFREFEQQMALNPPKPVGPDNPRPSGGGEVQGPPEPLGVWASFWHAAKESFTQGVSDVAASGKTTLEADSHLAGPKGLGQAAIGGLEIFNALPAGIGAAVQRAMQKYTPELANTPVPFGGGGANSTAGFLRTMLMTPQLLLDPKMGAVDPQALADSINEPMTYGELSNILAMFASAGKQGKVLGRIGGGKGESAPVAPQAAPAAQTPAPAPAAAPAGAGAPTAPLTTADLMRQAGGGRLPGEPRQGTPTGPPVVPPEVMTTEKLGRQLAYQPGQSPRSVTEQFLRMAKDPEVAARRQELASQYERSRQEPGGSLVERERLREQNRTKLSEEPASQTPEELGDLITGGQEFGILSAEKADLSPAENATRTAELKALLEDRGYKYHEAEGQYGGSPEKSFVVEGLSTEDALDLGTKFNQESVLTKDGLVYTADRSVNPADFSKTDFSGTQADYFTKVTVGGKDVKFTVPVDFETKTALPAKPAAAAEPRIIGTPPEPAPGMVRVYRHGGEGRFAGMSEGEVAPFREAGPLHYVDVPEAELGRMQISAQAPDVAALSGNPTRELYLDKTYGQRLVPYYGEIAETQLPKVQAARERLQKTFDTLTGQEGKVVLRGELGEGTLSLKVVNDLATVGSAILWQGARDFKSWSAAMVKEFGEVVTPHLAELYPKAKDALGEVLEKAKYGLPSSKKLLKLFEEGEFGMEWYDKARVEMEKTFGIHANTYADLLAATSPNTDVAGNITRANKALKMILTGEKGNGIRFTKDDGFLDAHVGNLNRVAEGQPLSGPKVGAFAAALKGDENAVVVDTWMARAFGLVKDAEKINMRDNPRVLGFIQKTVTDMAESLGVTPRQLQAAIWVAKKVRDEGAETKALAGRPLHELVAEKLEASDLKDILTGGRGEEAVPAWVTEDGQVSLGTLMVLTRTVIGGAAGAAMGDDLESSMRYAAIGMGLGAAASRALALQLTKRMKSIDPDGARMTTFTANADPSKLADMLKAVTRRSVTASTKDQRADFNTPRMDTTREAKSLILTLDKQYEALRQFRSRSHAETAELSKDSRYNSASEILKLEDDTPLSGPDYLAARGVMNHVAEEAIREGVLGENAPKLRNLIDTLGQVAGKVKEVRTSIARAEESGRIKSSSENSLFDLEAFAKKSAATRAGLMALSDEELFGAIKNLADASKVTTLARATAKVPSVFWDVYYGLNLFSSPWFHFRNTIGASGSTVFGLADRQMGEIIATPFRSAKAGSTHIALGEAADMARAMGANIRNAMRAAKDNWQTGDSLFGPGKVQEALGQVDVVSAANATRTGTIHGKFLDSMLGLARKNLRFAGSVDEFFGYLNFAGELAAQARRGAQHLEGDAKLLEMARLHAEPTTEMLLAAKAFAEEQIFSKAFAPGTLGARAESMASHPAMRLTVTPFFRTPMRLAEYSTVHTPIINVVAKQFWSDISSGGAKAELAFGKLAVGSGIVYAVSQLVQDGYITGDAPRDARLRTHMEEAGWQSRSIYNPVNGKYYSYDNLEPVSTIVATVANFQRMWTEMPDHGVMEGWTALSLALAQSGVAKRYWQGISDLLDTVDSLGDSDAATKNAIKFVANRLSTLTPGSALLRQVRQSIDPEKREPGERQRVDDSPAWREVRKLYEFWANQVPGFSKTVPAHKNMITGEPILYEGAFGDYTQGLTPFRVTTNPGDPVLNEIVVLGGAHLPKEIPRVIGGTSPSDGIRLHAANVSEGVLLSLDERARLETLLTKEMKDPFGLTLHQALTSLVTEKGPYAFQHYSDQSEGKDGGKSVMLYQVWSAFLKNAEQQLLAENKNLADMVRRQKVERELGRMPEPQQQQLRPLLTPR